MLNLMKLPQFLQTIVIPSFYKFQKSSLSLKSSLERGDHGISFI